MRPFKYSRLYIVVRATCIQTWRGFRQLLRDTKATWKKPISDGISIFPPGIDLSRMRRRDIRELKLLTQRYFRLREHARFVAVQTEEDIVAHKWEPMFSYPSELDHGNVVEISGSSNAFEHLTQLKIAMLRTYNMIDLIAMGKHLEAKEYELAPYTK